MFNESCCIEQIIISTVQYGIQIMDDGKRISRIKQALIRQRKFFSQLDALDSRFEFTSIDIAVGITAVRYPKPLVKLHHSSAAAQCSQILNQTIKKILDAMLTQNVLPGFWQQLLTGFHGQPAA